MGRVMKGKKGKASLNATEDLEKDAVEQGNGSVGPSDEESGNEKRNSVKKSKRGRKSEVSKSKANDSDDESTSAASRSKKGKRGRKSRENGEGSEVEADEDSEDSAPLSKKSKKVSDKIENNDNLDGVEDAAGDGKDEEEDYEVEKIVDFKMQGGKKCYRVRWKGFEEDKDTWEHEGNLNCPELIEEFLSENPDAVEKSSKSKSKKKAGEKKKGKKMKNSTSSKEKPEPAGGDDQKDYEVEKIIDVYFKKNGEREFLIRWKGFTGDDDTWEPESNLNCPDLIEKFMQKVKKAREVPVRELRVAPQVTKRFTLNTTEQGRRLSGRHQSKQRATYYNTE